MDCRWPEPRNPSRPTKGTLVAQSLTSKLDAGMPFPDFELHVLDSAPTSIKEALAGSWSILLLYRGHW